MGLFQAKLAAVPEERRAEPRTRVSCPATLHLTVAHHPGTLWDLSITGARFHTANPPPVGMTALLQWHTHEVFCKVIWATGDTCGLVFDRPLKRSQVDDTVQDDAARNGPVAAVTNIPLGQKRRRG